MRNSNCFRAAALALLLGVASAAAAQANLQIDTPALSALRGHMKERHGQLLPFYSSGAVGLTRDGNIALRDANAVPLAQRAQVNALVSGGNQDRAELYREVARANGKPEWENDIRNTFGQRWIERAPAGWYYQDANGAWVQKK